MTYSFVTPVDLFHSLGEFDFGLSSYKSLQLWHIIQTNVILIQKQSMVIVHLALDNSSV